MADTTPRLNSNPVNAQSDYAPVSWLAATALAIAGIFAVVLICLVLAAFSSNKPLIETWLIVPPILGIVLAFAARRHIRNSEGTRTGLKLATWAWWICVVTGLSYAAYMRATEYTIELDTEKQFNKWAENVKTIEPGVPNDPALAKAFAQTLPPAQRVEGLNTTMMQDRFGAEFTVFRQNKLLMVLLRNQGQCEMTPHGLKHWQQTTTRIECALAATLKCPEGEFQMIVPMVATVEKGKREWQIGSFDGYIQEGSNVKRTQYGWLVEWLEITARGTVEQFLQAASAKTNVDGFPRPLMDGILAQPLAYESYVTGKLPRGSGERVAYSAYYRTAIVGNLGVFWPTSPEYSRGLKSDFFVQTPLPDGSMGHEGTREDFLFCWNNVAFDKIAPAGRHFSNSMDKNCMIRFLSDRIEIHVPIELKVAKSDQKDSAALGRIVLTIDDPATLAKLDEARTEGKNGKMTDAPASLPKENPPWKIVRIESNLKVIRPPAGSQGPKG